MTSHERVMSTLSAVLPTCHMEWPEEGIPPLPWCVFALEDTKSFYADNQPYMVTDYFAATVAQARRDAALERRIDEALESEFVNVTKDEAWTNEEKCLYTTYKFACIREE